MAMTGEFEYYASGSGLPATATLSEHQRGLWAAVLLALIGLTAEQARAMSHTELELASYQAQLGDEIPGETLVDLRYRFFRQASGLAAGNAVNDHMVAVFTA